MFFNFILDMKKISSFVELNEIVLIIIIINNRWRFMDMIYQDETLFVDLSGNIDISIVRDKLFSVIGQYNIKVVVVDTHDVFNYKRSAFSELRRDYSRMYGGSLVIKR